MPAAVASRYARALVDVVLAPASQLDPDRVREDLRSFELALAESTELANALESPAVTRSRKRAVIARLGQSLGISRVANNFLFVLIDHRRMAELSGIIAAFEKLVDERLGILQVEVTSAQQLKQPQQDDLVQQLVAMTGKKIVLDLRTDPDLLGGLVVRLGSTVYDGSVQGQLEALGRELQGA
jgi:F-type H+-transporting ATPase subunit delta